MTLAEEIQADMQGQCVTCAFLRTLASKERAEWEQVIADPIHSAGAITRALRRRSVTVTDSSIKRHRVNHVA